MVEIRDRQIKSKVLLDSGFAELDSLKRCPTKV